MNLNFKFAAIVLLFTSGLAAQAAEPILWLDAGNAETLNFGDEQIQGWKDANGRFGSFPAVLQWLLTAQAV